jgi:hypothetical protein
MTEKDWSLDETINQIKHLLLEKDAEILRLREENKYLTYRLARIDGTYDTMFSVVEAVAKQNAALKEGE